jgi:hypothetical protein
VPSEALLTCPTQKLMGSQPPGGKLESCVAF